jgi:excisionase family DNA binding protein
MDAEGWMNAETAARYLGMPSRRALYQAVRRGQIPGHRIGRRLRFSKAELDQWVSSIKTLAH